MNLIWQKEFVRESVEFANAKVRNAVDNKFYFSSLWREYVHLNSAIKPDLFNRLISYQQIISGIMKSSHSLWLLYGSSLRNCRFHPDRAYKVGLRMNCCIIDYI